MDAVNHVDPVNQEGPPSLIRLIACPHLADEWDKIDRYVPAGPTVAAHLRAIGWKPEGLHARVFIDGEFVEQARWKYTVPQAGQSFVTRVIPSGGQGGGKDALRIVSMLAIVVASMFVPPLIGATGVAGALFVTTPGMAAFTSAAVSIAGSLRATSLLPARRV